MKQFIVNSFKLQSEKWVPAGTLFDMVSGDAISVQEVEFPPEYRFDTEEEANDFFRNFYKKEGLSERES